MQQNGQQHEQFITELGNLLVTQTSQRHSLSQRRAVANLAEYVSSARRHHKMSRAALAHKVGKSEVDIFALEQGLYSDAYLDPVFLRRLALALGEEVETLMLLLGRPACMLPLVAKAPADGSAIHDRTASQQSDNRRVALQWANLLYEGCRNLMDSAREGRLFCYARTIAHAGSVGLYRMSISVAVLVCLLLFWASTYSLSSFFDAQSVVQSYTMHSSLIDETQSGTPVRDAGQPSTSVDLASVSLKEARNIAPYRHVGQPAKVAFEPADDEQVTATSFFVLPMPDEAQQCDTRIRSKFALCPV